jgi:hypothetical protein
MGFPFFGRPRGAAPYIFYDPNLAARSLIAFGHSLMMRFPFSGRTRRSAPDVSNFRTTQAWPLLRPSGGLAAVFHYHARAGSAVH